MGEICRTVRRLERPEQRPNKVCTSTRIQCHRSAEGVRSSRFYSSIQTIQTVPANSCPFVSSVRTPASSQRAAYFHDAHAHLHYFLKASMSEICSRVRVYPSVCLTGRLGPGCDGALPEDATYLFDSLSGQHIWMFFLNAYTVLDADTHTTEMCWKAVGVGNI